MQYFIGIVPPEDIKKRILKFQQQWGNNDLFNVVEPHITVKAQGGLTSDKDWLTKVKIVSKSFSSFHVSLNEPKYFGESVLYLSVDSENIDELHREIVNVVAPEHNLIKKYMELEDYVPHLTLGQTNFGLTSKELKDIGDNAVRELSPYPTFEVNFIRVYQEVEANKYIKHLDIPLQNRL
ncbi:2'-5' RNA ligase family protein [Gottfriedia solisilvae]|uniref:2'-5' RNA ligase n=1 Tax=Gottfriedia solisilvae TaxID=1516104 RepID=A0A8J3EZ15_9BACI|nr:2'-5' RNA ligase family protein [Gottfriedia solisilvae]GGI13936.1 hypothetical protein GCM10007380_20430 [Gottfriedia solisilvae]